MRQSEEGIRDEEAFVAAARRDPHAFGPLYRRYVDPVYRYCFRRLGTKEDSEDATAQVFAKALTALPRLGNQPFNTWLFAIARNVVTDFQRAYRMTSPIEAAANREDASPTPEQRALAAEDGRQIRALLDELPDNQRELMELRLAGLTDIEIADVLGKSHGAIRVAQHRIVLRLRELRESQSEGGGNG